MYGLFIYLYSLILVFILLLHIHILYQVNFIFVCFHQKSPFDIIAGAKRSNLEEVITSVSIYSNTYPLIT